MDSGAGLFVGEGMLTDLRIQDAREQTAAAW